MRWSSCFFCFLASGSIQASGTYMSSGILFTATWGASFNSLPFRWSLWSPSRVTDLMDSMMLTSFLESAELPFCVVRFPWPSVIPSCLLLLLVSIVCVIAIFLLAGTLFDTLAAAVFETLAGLEFPSTDTNWMLLHHTGLDRHESCFPPANLLRINLRHHI